MVHRREIDGDEVVFGNQGDLYLNAMTWFDHGTGSIWSQPTGEAIMGPRTGTRLELLPSTLTTWANWQAGHPDTVALAVSTRTNRFTLDRQAVVVVIADDSLAVTMPDLDGARVVNEEVAGEPIAFVLTAVGQRPLVWLREHRGRVVELAFDAEQLVDRATGTVIDPATGRSVDGSIHLEPVPSFGSFPSDYARIWPEGRVWRPSGAIPAELYSDAPP